MATMTKKVFVLISDILREEFPVEENFSGPADYWQYLVFRFATVLDENFDNFNRQKFISACQGE